jgi:serine/threonine protein kinase
LESFQDEHFVTIAMEFIQHGDLVKQLREPWGEPDTQIITIQLLEGLIIMHRLGITHRDLRPEVCSQGSTWGNYSPKTE